MSEEIEGDEFIVDKILDKRSRNGKIEYYLSWKVGLILFYVCSVPCLPAYLPYEGCLGQSLHNVI